MAISSRNQAVKKHTGIFLWYPGLKREELLAGKGSSCLPHTRVPPLWGKCEEEWQLNSSQNQRSQKSGKCPPSTPQSGEGAGSIFPPLRSSQESRGVMQQLLPAPSPDWGDPDQREVTGAGERGSCSLKCLFTPSLEKNGKVINDSERSWSRTTVGTAFLHKKESNYRARGWYREFRMKRVAHPLWNLILKRSHLYQSVFPY